MTLLTLIRNNIVHIFALVVLFSGVYYRKELKREYKNYVNKLVNDYEEKYNKLVFSHKQLSEYNGINRDKLYLSLLGTVYDVTEGSRHYGKGGSYHYFIGKDGSRAFVSGNFTDESVNKDHTLDFNCNELHTLIHWNETLNNKYIYIGVLNGRYFDQVGRETEYTVALKERIKQCNQERQAAKEQDLIYPPCNIAWSADEGTTVWCSKSSGGVWRNWEGVPRQFYMPGNEKPRCICLNLSQKEPGVLIKEYDNCSPNSNICNLKNT